MKIHPDMNLSLMNNNELILVHCYTHNSYFLKEPFFKKEDLKGFHKQIISQMEKKGIEHLSFDKLDN